MHTKGALMSHTDIVLVPWLIAKFTSRSVDSGMIVECVRDLSVGDFFGT